MQIAESDLKQFKTVLDFLIYLEAKLKNTNNLKIDYPFKGKYGQSQGFGENPEIYKKWGYKGHFGVDFLTPWGTEIIAIDKGIVSRSGKTDGNGNYIEIKHNWGSSLYMHFKEPANYKTGETIEKGYILGYAGNTGFVLPAPTLLNPKAGTHLHFSIKINGIKNPDYKDFIDPNLYFKS